MGLCHKGVAVWGHFCAKVRLKNSWYFCVFKYAGAVKQKVWNEAENRERDWGEMQKYAQRAYEVRALHT